jgi:hypothetical protein
MRRLATLALLAALLSPTTASGQYTFGDWASDQGYSPGDIMPNSVHAGWDWQGSLPQITSIEGVGEFDWTTTPTQALYLQFNQISSIDSDDFSGLTSLGGLELGANQISSIESGTFGELTNLDYLSLSGNQLSNIEPGDFSGLTNLWELWLADNQLSSIESGAFSGLTNLSWLWLSSNQLSSIESGMFSGLPNLECLSLDDNQLSSIEAGDFSGLANLEALDLNFNQLSSIEAGAFSGLTNLRWLSLGGNTALTELNLTDADFLRLDHFGVRGNVNITSVSLKDTVVNQTSLATLLDGGDDQGSWTGIGELDGITEMDLSGIDFADITDLEPLYVMDDLTDLWLVDTENVDATDWDLLLDNLETIEGIDAEGILYMTYANFDDFNISGGGLLAAWDAEPGHHVEYVGSLLLGDVNHDGVVDGLDVDPFIDVLLNSQFATTADMNGDGAVNGLDVAPFVAVVFGGVQSVPEPSTLLLCIIALGVLGGWRKWSE